MSIFAGIEDTTNLQASGDRLGGAIVRPSSVYEGTIKMAYIVPAKSGAVGVTLELTLPDGSSYRDTQYVTSGTAKGGKNYYEKDGQKIMLPGFETINDLCLLTTNQSLKELEPSMEEKMIPLWNSDARGEVPTKVPVIMPLIDQKVKFALLHVIENKAALNQSTSKYEPTNEKVEKNELVKYFHFDTGLTVTEAQAQKTDGEFIVAWAGKNEGKVVDKFKPVANSPAQTGAAPAMGGSNAAPAASARPSLFPQK